MCKCKCRSVSVQGIFRKNPSQCFREKARLPRLPQLFKDTPPTSSGLVACNDNGGAGSSATGTLENHCFNKVGGRAGLLHWLWGLNLMPRTVRVRQVPRCPSKNCRSQQLHLPDPKPKWDNKKPYASMALFPNLSWPGRLKTPASSHAVTPVQGRLETHASKFSRFEVHLLEACHSQGRGCTTQQRIKPHCLAPGLALPQ